MFRCFVATAIVAAILLGASSEAAQRITLRSGTVLIGDVAMVDGSLQVAVAGSDGQAGTIIVPFDQVATVTPVDTPQPGQARRLLMVALEAKILDRKTQTSGLLREAYRLAPEDPQIAFWYATSLEEDGYGTLADHVVSRHRQAVLAEYPGAADDLFKRIAERVEMERLPEPLIEKIYALDAAAETVDTLTSDRVPTHCYFRLLDQAGAPLPKDAYRVTCNGANQELSEFDDGYFLFSFGRYRNNRDPGVELHVARIGYEPKVFDITASARKVQNAGTFVVKKYAARDKRSVAVRLTDLEDDPIVGGRLTVRPKSTRHRSETTLQLQTDENGLAKPMLGPGEYTVDVSMPGFLTRSEVFVVPPTESKGGNPDDVDSDTAGLLATIREKRVILYKRIDYRLRVVWQSEGATPGSAVTEGETVLDTSTTHHNHHESTLNWLRVMQVESEVGLAVAPQYPYQPGGGGWIRVRPAVDDLAGSQKAFSEIDLDGVARLRSDWRRPPLLQKAAASHPQAPKPVVCRTGDCFVGEVSHVDHRYGSGRVMTVRFKVFAETASAPTPANPIGAG